MSGHTNRNKRSGGNSRSRHGPPRQRGSDGRSGQSNQAKNVIPPSAAQAQSQGPQATERKTEQRAEREDNRPRRIPQLPAQDPVQPETPVAHDMSNASDVPDETAPELPHDGMDASSRSESGSAAEPPEGLHPRSRAPFAAASRGGHAYIPASGLRQGVGGQNGHHRSNGHMPVEQRYDPAGGASDYDGGDGDGAGAIPATWRAERLTGGVDSTPRESPRPEFRGEVGPLIDSLHELFAQDRAVASQGDSARCGICYLHFPLTALEYREAEGFYVCAGCKRALGHNPLMMIRRQQPPHAG